MTSVQVPTVSGTPQAEFKVISIGSEVVQPFVPIDSLGNELGTALNPLSVEASSLPLPSGAATEATIASIDASVGDAGDLAASSDTGSFSILSFIKRSLQNWTSLLAKIPSLVSGRIPVDPSGVTSPVSVSSLPLPSGAATEASLDLVADGLASVASASGATTDLEASGNGSIIAVLKRLRTLLSGGLPGALVGGRLDVNVGATAAPASLPLPSGAATEASILEFLDRLGQKADATGAYQDPMTVISALKTINEYLDANTAALSNLSLQLPGTLTLDNNLRCALREVEAGVVVSVDGSGVTQPVSGTVQIEPGSDPILIDADGTIAVEVQAGGVVGTTTDLEASGDGSVVAILKRLRTLLNDGLPDLVSSRVPVDPSGVTSPVYVHPTTGAGVSVDRKVCAASTNATLTKNSAGVLYGYMASNAGSSNAYLRFYNSSSSPTVGTTTIAIGPIMIPSGATGHILFPVPIVMSTGISWSVTAGISDSDTTALGSSSEVSVSVLYV